MYHLLTALSMVVALAGDAGQGLKPWALNKHPTDVAKSRVEEITSRQHQYVIVQGGTMDGENCRSPMGYGASGEGACEQTWQSNRAVRLENVGQVDVVNPWLSNGRNNFRSLDEIVAAAITPDMSDKEKSLALWFQEIRFRYHHNGSNAELGDPIKVFNVYGHNTCGNDSICLAGLLHKAGFEKVAPARTLGHCISQAFFDGRWNLLDGDEQVVYLLRDNETIANDRDIARDHDLVKRTHTGGILQTDSRATSETHASDYVFDGEINGDRNCKGDTTMNMVLRPNEAIIWRWGHLDPVKCIGGERLRYPDTICNGLWEYRPDFSKDTWRKGADTVEGVRSGADGLAAEEGKIGTIVWTVRSPYVFVGGTLDVEGSGPKFALSWDGKTWQEVEHDLDSFFPPKGTARYQYQLRCQLTGGARLTRLGIVNDVQMAPLTLPGMVVGPNTFTYSDQSSGERNVQITHEWVERSASKAPDAPPAAVYPADGGVADGTDIRFKWQVPSDPDGDKIADYHFELSNRPDMRWPLSTNFYKLVSKTADRGQARYTLPEPGLLTPDRPYYWRVRARDDKGVWGPWSKTWSFTAHGPAYPLEVTLSYDQSKQTGMLRWKPNPVGRQPVTYRVYGSDEKGFTISDVPYKVNVGVSKELPTQIPANFIAETTATELTAIGSQVDLPNATKTYYRVVAVDQHGKRSGPSDYATAPRPIIYSNPAVTAKVGVQYQYQVLANRCLGDLRLDGRGTASFWDIEKPKFTLARGPTWLKVDAATGVLSGTPDAAGKAEVVVTVIIDRPVRKLDEATLKWGNEKITSTTTERVGEASQPFVIEVTP